MNSGFRSMAGVALSLWMGALACLMGCALPVSASSHQQATGLQAKANCDANSNLGETEPCCHHGSSSSKKTKHDNQIACCVSDATVIQKQDPVSISRAESVAFVVVVFHPSIQLTATWRDNTSSVWQTGRDVLLQARILRI
jgi:hypothetical protein